MTQMFNRLKNIDAFTKNVIIVFAGNSLVNLLNLLFQLLIAHKFFPSDFAAFNSLLSIYLIVAMPLQVALAKYTAAFKAQNQTKKIQFLLSSLLKKTTLLAILTFIIFYFGSSHINEILKISSITAVRILAILLALSWIIPVLIGGIQGLELFGWFTSIQIITGVTKLGLAFLFILLGFKIAGVMGAFLISAIITLIIAYLPLKNLISFNPDKEKINLTEILFFIFPIAITTFCFFVLVNSDMILVKYYFDEERAGIYSLAQIVGKIFLFFPLAISTVMFPRTSSLSARNMDTSSTLTKSLLYGSVLCVIAALFYNLLPAFVLKVLTGKPFSESIILGRLFSISMSFFALLYILINYFLSIKDLSFIKYLVLFTVLQLFAVIFYHRSLIQIQSILCINAILLFCMHLMLTRRNRQFMTGRVIINCKIP